MTFLKQLPPLWALIVAAGLSACSGGGFTGGGAKSESKKDEDSEDTEAGEPTEVAGAFLTCTYIQDPAFGCTAVDGKKQPLSKSDNKYTLTLYNDAGDEVELKSSPAPEASEFHVIGNLPEAYHDNGTLKMNIKPISGNALAAEASLPTKDIAEQPLGTQLADDDPVTFGDGATGVDASKLNLKNFTVMSSWTPAKTGSIMGSIAVETKTAVPSNFCSAGQINQQLSADAQVLTAGFVNMFKSEDNQKGIGDVNMKILSLPSGATVIGTNTNICFKKFSSELFGGDTALAHVGSGCVFVWGKVDQGEYLFIGKEEQGGKKITSEDLRAFAKAMNERPGGCQ